MFFLNNTTDGLEINKLNNWLRTFICYDRIIYSMCWTASLLGAKCRTEATNNWRRSRRCCESNINFLCLLFRKRTINTKHVIFLVNHTCVTQLLKKNAEKTQSETRYTIPRSSKRDETAVQLLNLSK